MSIFFTFIGSFLWNLLHLSCSIFNVKIVNNLRNQICYCFCIPYKMGMNNNVNRKASLQFNINILFHAKTHDLARSTTKKIDL